MTVRVGFWVWALGFIAELGLGSGSRAHRVQGLGLLGACMSLDSGVGGFIGLLCPGLWGVWASVVMRCHTVDDINPALPRIRNIP